ncbi:hypothetical protein L227DRAFT_357362 [Lentinus tigrinus ALCF2SS1-6]|uniref:SEC7 domain-containing protein n=1 Tax=Lentinus tigrinus ALCF2SS1-6 TaxID=1328759 RepID=A0A5C2SIN0_9APHY|nr:hypothetical protein L227DRAFT_357362 [Lentinus tigrinus ALCF2SS1-6]
MDHSSAAEQRATAVAKLKRAASLPRMKDGRRPPMHVEAVSEGERSQGEERNPGEERNDGEERSGRSLSREGSSGRELGEEATANETLNGAHVNPVPASEPEVAGEAVEPEQSRNGDADGEEGDGAPSGAMNTEDTVKTPKKRRSRSRTRSRGSKDMKGKALAKQSAQLSSTSHTNESSADEYYPSGPGEDPPPSPPLISPIPSHLAGFPTSHFLRSPIAPVNPLFYPGTTPSTPLPSLDDIQKGVGAGLFRSNSAGAARAMAMSKLTGGTEPIDLTFISSQSPTPSRLQRNNTVAGGERMAARRMLLHRLGNRINNQTDGDQTSGGEEAPPPPITAAKKRRRRSHRRSSSRASTVVDDREDREPPSTTPNTPLVPPSPLPPFLRATPEPPRPPSSASRAPNGDLGRVSPRMPPNGSAPYNYETPLGHRGVVIEEEDDVPLNLHLPSTPARNHRMLAGGRLPHTSDAPSNASTDSAPAGSIAVPMFMSNNASFRQDLFPASPFQTPLKEPVFPDEEEVPFQEQRSRSRLAGPTSAFERDSEISWVAELVTERPPVDDDDDEEDEDDEEPVEQGPEEETEESSYPDVAGQRSSAEFSPDAERPSAPKPLIVDVETSPETTPAHVPPSPSSIIALSMATEQPQVEPPPSPPTYPMRLSVARSPSAAADYTDWDDVRAESTPKRQGDGISTWEKMKGAFSRSGSTTGRRSRTNSLSARERRYNTDSSVSRESGASLNSGKLEKGESPGVFAMQQAQPPLMQSHSASASILSLPPQSAPPGAMSPVPPASSADLLKYADSKLFPFPALKQLEEQRRARGITPSSSSPDVASPTMGFPISLEQVPSTSTASSSGATTKVADGRDRKLSHQASDSRLWSKFSQPLHTSGSMGKLPTNRDGVRKWLSLFKSQPSTPTASNGPSASSRAPIGKKPSLTDLLMQRKDSELTAQSWDGSDKSRTPTNVTSAQRLGTPKESHKPTFDASSDSQAHGDADMSVLTSGATSPAYVLSDYSSPGFPSPPDPPSSTTPDPQSSLDDFPTRSTSESFSSTMSSSHHSPDPAPNEHLAGAIIMERLDEVLGRGSKSSLWPSAIDDPPRKLILSSPVLQVANANTVKDRFLFLFNDILIIAKPILQDMDALLDATKPSPLDRKFIVKSVIQLRELRFSGDRDDTRTKTSATSNPMRHPLMRNFVNQFAKDPDHAVLTLLGKTSARDDVALGQLLFRTIDLDRARLGDYLARRSSKVALKSFVDSFGLTGLRIDKALRVFLQAIHIPSRPTAGHSSALDYLLDSFASRWYEANATMVAYDKDVAIKLTRAIVQLNEVMHSGIAQEPGITGYPKRNVIARDFVEAFRRSDPRGLVSEDLLDKIYASVRREKLFQARVSSSVATQPDIVINIKRPLPPRLTYRVQSEPVILRIPQPDPQLTIQLFGQDLVFDPPVLNFSKSSEVSFRVTGTALGNKTIIMWRSGPNALAYSGLPLSSSVVVERSFMRNTFQVAFLNHTGLKRRYMFSVDDPLIRHQWTVSLKRQIDIASSAPVAGPSTSRAAEALAFKVLQDTLINSEDNSAPYNGPYLSPVDQAYARLNGGNRSRSGSVNSALGRSGTRRLNVPPSHTRSKSRSQLYRQNGAGKFESELDEDDERALDSSPSQRPDGRLWSGHELEVYCQQNSSIPAVLAYLQVGLVENGHANGHGNGNGAAS